MQSIAIRSAPESCLIALEWASSALPDNWTHLHSWHRCIHPFIYSFIVFPIVFVHSHSFATAMLSGLPGRKLLRPTFILWALFAFTFLFGPASAVPFHRIRDGLTPRADKPGMGVELEIKNINIIGPSPLVGEKREAIKGAIMTPIGYAGVPKLNWVLTAEVGDSNILPEAIVDGLRNKVGDLKSKAIGEQIYQFFVWPIAFMALFLHC
jgi:hypothetical protein